MTYEEYRLVFIVFASLSAISLIISASLFFAFNVPKIVGYVSGNHAKKEIQNIKQRSKTTNSVEAYSSTKKRGILSASSFSRRLNGGFSTEKIATSKFESKEPKNQKETSLLGHDNETEQTKLLKVELSNETVLLEKAKAEITVLQEIIFIHTKEKID